MFLFEHPLALILLILIAGFLLSLSISAGEHNALRVVVLGTSLCALFVGVVSCLAFNKADLGFQFITRLHFIPEYNLALTLGADGLSMIFLLLTLFIFPILFLSAWNVTKQPKQFLNHLLAIEILLVFTFSVLDIFYFYVFFESLLIPMFLLIGGWGARERKIKAAYYFFLYTLFGSLFMLFGMIYLYFITGSTNFFVLLNTQLEAEQQQLIWLCFFLAFAVKMPLFPLHIWLPEAHVEAPTVGSMLLASLLLKLGGYGFLRFSLTFLAEGSHQYAPLVCTCSLLGVLYGSLSTLRQIDLKRIIAYSSVAHMNLVMLGLFSFNQQGLEGATYLMVGHGVVSAALFFCVGVLYDRHHSRLLRYYGGLVAVMPLFAAFFLAFTLANMGFPGTSNFLGETLVFLGIFALSSTVMLFASPGIVLSAAYSTWLYNRVTFGTLKTTYIKEFTDLTRRETAVFATLLLFMLVLGISANFILDFVHVALKGIIINAEIANLKASTSYAALPPFTTYAFGPSYLSFAQTLYTATPSDHRQMFPTLPNNFETSLVCLTISNKENFVVDYSVNDTASLSGWLIVAFCLFLIGLLGMVYNYKNFLVTMMCVEIMYLGAVTSFVLYGLIFHDTMAAVYGLLVLIFAACESALGLGLLLSIYRFGRRIDFDTHTILGG